MGFSAVVGLAGPAQAVELVTNGGVESTTNGSGRLDFNTDVTGWSSPAVKGQFSYNFVLSPSEFTSGVTSQYGALSFWETSNGGPDSFVASSTAGNFVAADGGYAPPTLPIIQTLSGLVVGHKYAVSFDWAAAQQAGFNGATNEGWTVSLGGQSIATSIYSNPNHGFSGWFHEKFVFTFDGPNSVLSFLANGTPEGVPPFSLLDSVSASAVPESATWTMVIAGFGLVGVAARRRRCVTA